MNIYWSAAFIAWTALFFTGGIYVEYERNTASQVKNAYNQSMNLGQGQASIMRFNQQWSILDEKNPCDNQLISPSERKLLR
jgi:hypothetical protein